MCLRGINELQSDAGSQILQSCDIAADQMQITTTVKQHAKFIHYIEDNAKIMKALVKKYRLAL